jgi:LPXTG-motif cell wall-anchored protein
MANALSILGAALLGGSVYAFLTRKHRDGRR